MLDRTFQLTAHRTTVRREVMAGLTTFAAMGYILAVNPNLLAEAGMPKEALITVTALAAATGCLLMAGIANYPIALAPGMGTNAYFAFVICIGTGLPWQAALSLTFWNGILFLLLSLTGFRRKLAEALPDGIKIGIQTGLGFFIAFVGLQNVGIVVNDDSTLVRVGDLSSPAALLVMAGVVLIAVLTLWRFQAPILATILLISIAGLFVPAGDGSRITELPHGVLSLPPGIGETFGALDLWYPFTHFNGTTVSVLLTLLMLDLFDSIGTLIGVARRANLMDVNGRMPRMSAALSADAIATSIGAILGTSTTTSYVESATGVEAGGRTGLTAVVVAACFLLALFFSPLIVSIPAVATAPALLMVGVMMAQGMRDLDYSSLAETTAAVLTMILIPLTFSITEGIGVGIVVWVLIKLCTGKYQQIPALTWVIAGVFALYFASPG